MQMFSNRLYDLILLDVMLPEISGIEVCQRIRERSNVPIIMLTAKGEDMDKILGLEYGADDYMTKPFSLKELYARIQVILRRVTMDEAGAPHDAAMYRSGDLLVDMQKKQCVKQGTEVPLTPSEFKILSALISYPGKVFSRDELIELVFDHDFDGFDRAIDSHIKNLRHKLEDDSRRPVYVKTVHGMGYKFGACMD
jgi:DNA-binding response OmpR family regulator